MQAWCFPVAWKPGDVTGSMRCPSGPLRWAERHTSIHVYKSLHQNWPSPERIMGNCTQGVKDFFLRPKNTNVRLSLPAVTLVWQIIIIILFGVFVRYNEESNTRWVGYKRAQNITSDAENDYYYRYPSKLIMWSITGITQFLLHCVHFLC